jgi:hypothetical protein
MLTDFYVSFSALCFTILSLWLVVVQQQFRPVRVDAVLLSALVFLGVNVAWLLLFGAGPAHASPAAKVPGAVQGPGPV